MTPRMRRWLLALLTLAAAGVVFIGEDAREPNGPLPIDRSVLRYSLDHRTSAWIAIARALSHIGDPLPLAGLAIVTTVLLWTIRRSIVQAAIPLSALLLGAAIEFTTKRIIARPRPPAIYHILPESDPSFPSGHATGSAAFFVALALVLSPRLRTTAGRVVLLLASGLLAAAVGFSRVVLGVHWLSDVAAGWLLGVAVAVSVVLLSPRLAARDQRRAPGRSTPTDLDQTPTSGPEAV